LTVISWLSAVPTRLREQANLRIRATAGLTQDPPDPCLDPREAYLPVDGVARLVHGDISSMMIGGLASLFFEMLHPHTMAGVAQHSRYQDDPLGRVLQTANFIGFTTYGSKSRAADSIERVRAIHQGVRGVADDGVAYNAGDPHLLGWIHCAGTDMFLTAFQRYARATLTSDEADRYVEEMAIVARDLGGEAPPTNVAELKAVLEGFRPELRLSADAVTARDFVARGVLEGAVQKLLYRLLVRSAFDLQPPWAQTMLGVRRRPLLNQFIIRPATRVVARALRVAVPPTTRVNERG
jgi:uncharacterized protein (DUF2236 family)